MLQEQQIRWQCSKCNCKEPIAPKEAEFKVWIITETNSRVVLINPRGLQLKFIEAEGNMVTLTLPARAKVLRMTKCLKATHKQERDWWKEELKGILLGQETVEFMVPTLDLSNSKCRTVMALVPKIRVRYLQRRETTLLEIQGYKDNLSHQTKALTKELRINKISASNSSRTSQSCKVRCVTTWGWSNRTRTKRTLCSSNTQNSIIS